jgi:CRISPR-associated protein Csy1
MLDPAIQEFLEGKDKTLEDWLPGAANRAKQLSFCSHPPKYSHPSAKITILKVDGVRNADGLLRSGNVDVEYDVVGNAASLDVHKFLSLLLLDGKTVLAHLQDNSDYIQSQLNIPSASVNDLTKGLLAIQRNDTDKPTTHGGVKQVYFPIENEQENYHLLSVLTPSGILYAVKSRINAMRFSEDAKASREARKNNQLADDYSEIYGLTSIGFGGTKPQNISVLNNQNGGVAYLLSSLPPTLEKRRISPPRKDFFDASYTAPARYKEQFEALHKALALDINNVRIRQRIKGLVKAIYFELIDRSWTIRYLKPGWSDSDRYQSLPKHQKLWLDQQYHEQRAADTDWLDTIKQCFVRWFINGYEKLLDKQAINLSDYEFIELKRWLDDIEEGLK